MAGPADFQEVSPSDFAPSGAACGPSWLCDDGNGSRGVVLSGSHVGSLQGAVRPVEMEVFRERFGLGFADGRWD